MGLIFIALIMKYLLALLICVGVLHAQERLEEVIVSDTRVPKSRKNSGKAVILITANDIKVNSGLSLAQLLNQYAGIYISGAQLHLGQNLTYQIRGGNNRQVLVRINGVVVSDPSQIESEFDLRLLSLDQIESIEIVKGASSSLYGSGAATAVIDITTKNNIAPKTKLYISQQWGTQNTQHQKLGSLSELKKQDISLEKQIAHIGIHASLNKLTTDGMSSVLGTETDFYDRENIQLNAKSQYNGPLSWIAFYQRDVLLSEYDNTFPYEDADFSFESKQQRIGFAPSYRIEKSTIQAHLSWSDTKRTYASSYPADYASHVFSTELTWRYRSSERLTLLSGTLLQEMQSDFSDSDSSTHFQHDNIAFFVSAQWQHPKGYAFQLSGRNTVHSTFGAHQTFTINPYYVHSSDTGYFKFFGSLATSFIAPSQYKLYSTYYGNDQLQPEENRTFELGIEHVADRHRYTAVGFHRKEHHIIDFVYQKDLSGQYQNNSQAFSVRGVEVEAKWNLAHWNINTNYTFTERRAQSPLRLPKHMANLGLSYNRPKAQWSTHIRSLSSRLDQNSQTSQIEKLKEYILVDARVQFPKIMGSAILTIALTNIFDKQYTELYGFTTQGRNVTIGLNGDF